MVSLKNWYWNKLERNEPLLLPHTTLKIFEISHKHKYKNENYKSSRIKGKCLYGLGWQILNMLCTSKALIIKKDRLNFIK